MARPRFLCAALLLAVYVSGIAAQTGVLILGASGQLYLQAGALSMNVSVGGALSGLLQTAGSFGVAGNGSYALLANAGASAVAATLYRSRYFDGSTGVTGSVSAPFAVAGPTAAGAIGLSPGADAVRVVQLEPHGPEAQLYFDPVGSLPGGCNAVGATAYDATRSLLHAVCVAGTTATGAQRLLSYNVLTGTVARSVPLPKSAALRLSALAVEPTSGDVFTLGTRTQTSQPEIGRVAVDAAAGYTGTIANAGPTAVVFTAGLAAAFLQGSTEVVAFGVLLGDSGVALRTVDAGGTFRSDAPLIGGPLLDAFWLPAAPSVVAVGNITPSPPLSLAVLQAQLDALRAAATPPTCGPRQLLQFAAQAGGWLCADAPASVLEPGGYCRVDGSGDIACDVQPSALTPPTCMPPGGKLLTYSVTEGWACTCAPGYSGTSCDTLAAGGAAPATCAPPPCALPGGSSLYTYDNKTRTYKCICSPGFTQSINPAQPCLYAA